MSAAISLSAFEALGWSFRVEGQTVKARPPANASLTDLEGMRQHRTRLRTLLAIRSSDLCLADLKHDAAVISDRGACSWLEALEGAATSHGFSDWAEAEQIFTTKQEATFMAKPEVIQIFGEAFRFAADGGTIAMLREDGTKATTLELDASKTFRGAVQVGRHTVPVAVSQTGQVTIANGMGIL